MVAFKGSKYLAHLSIADYIGGGSTASRYINGGGVASRAMGNTTTPIESQIKRAGEQNKEYLEEAKALYEPYATAGISSLDEYMKLLLGGVDSLSGDKNFQDMKDYAERKVMANRAVSGLLRSGATASALDDALLRFQNDYYGNRLNQLLQGVGLGTSSTGAQASIFEKLGGNETDLASALANIQMQREANTATVRVAEASANAAKSAAKETADSSLWGGIIGGVMSAISDGRAKTHLRLVGKAKNGLNIYLGRYTKASGLDDGKDHLFLIAQEVMKVVPDAVTKDEKTGFLQVNYAKALGV